MRCQHAGQKPSWKAKKPAQNAKSIRMSTGYNGMMIPIDFDAWVETLRKHSGPTIKDYKARSKELQGLRDPQSSYLMHTSVIAYICIYIYIYTYNYIHNIYIYTCIFTYTFMKLDGT